MFLSNTLSRPYLEDQPERTTPQNDVLFIKERVFALELEEIKRIREMTVKDEQLQILTNIISDGWPETLTRALQFDPMLRGCLNRILGWKEHCDTPLILFTGLESQASSKITYQSVEFATVTGPNNVKSL